MLDLVGLGGVWLMVKTAVSELAFGGSSGRSSVSFLLFLLTGQKPVRVLDSVGRGGISVSSLLDFLLGGDGDFE